MVTPCITYRKSTHYYPFGLKHQDYSTGIRKYKSISFIPRPMGIKKEEVDYKFMYNSKEHQDELGLDWYDYGARNYDATLGRFMYVDPLAEEYSYQSPYNFSENRVVDGVELEGLEWKDFKSANTGATINRSEKINGKTVTWQETKVSVNNYTYSYSEKYGGYGYAQSGTNYVSRVRNSSYESVMPNTWSGITESSLTIYPKGENSPVKLSTTDVSGSARNTFKADFDKNIGAFSLDKVNAIKDNKLGKTLNAISYPVDVLAAYTGHPVLGGLSYSTKAYNIIGDGIIAQETGHYNDLKKEGVSSIVNEVVGNTLQAAQGKKVKAVYEAVISPIIDMFIKD